LLIACANLGNLQLARSAARARDFAIRAALGASRGKLMRQSLGESILLALLGGAAGVFLATVFLDVLAPSMLGERATGTVFAMDLRVLGFAVAIALFAGVVSGCVPAWFASRIDVNPGLKQQARGSSGDRSRQHVRQALIVVQIAFSLVLLAGSGFFIRGLQRVTSRDPGWKIEGLLKGTITLPETRHQGEKQFRQFHERVLERVTRLPGVENVALATTLPLQGYNTPRGYVVEGRAEPPRGQEPLAYDNIVSPEYFATLGIQLVEGRLFDRTAGPEDPRLIVINEAMARQLWPGESAVGKRIRDTSPTWHPWLEIVGVVRDVTFPGNFGALPTRMQIYSSINQSPWGYFTIVVRSAAPEALVELLRRAIAELDPDLPVVDLRPVTQAVANAQHDLRVANQLLAAFSALGLLLAAIGLYGVISGLVVQRTQEFGIRLALGAQPRDVLWMVLGKGALLAAFGTLAGLAGAAVLLRVLGILIPGLPGQDPVGIISVVALLLSVTLLATFLPARRATKVDPLIALRAE
jgi:predicted permease